jgi:hypothetical protein
MTRQRTLQALCTWLALGAAGVPAAALAQDQEPAQLQLVAALGVGAHSRAIVRPTDTGTQTLATSYVPAVELRLGVVAWPDADFSLAISVHYQTGLWLTVTELPQFALANEVAVRSQRMALSVSPSWRLAPQTRLGFVLGATLRSFWPEDRSLQTPSYNLVGPHARGELAIGLAGPVRLRVQPELQWLLLIDEHANSPTQGAAIGGELALELRWGPSRTLALSYRESHALLARGARFRDVERYLTVHIEEVF